MAKITTRPKQQEDWIVDLQSALEDATDGTASVKPTSKMVLSDDGEILIDQTHYLISSMAQIGRQLVHDNVVLTADNISLTHNNRQLQQATDRVIETFSNVPFDDALDHAATDLIMAIESSGVGEVNTAGELVFDARISLSQADLKPLLKEAINTWVEQRISQM